MSHIDLSRPAVCLRGLVMAGVLMLAACGSNGDEPAIDLPDSTTPSTADADDAAGEVSENGADDSVPTTDSEQAETDDVETDDVGTTPDDGPVFSLVRFDNEEHTSTDPLDEALVRTKIEEAATAAFDNWITCLTFIDQCDFARDVAPSLSNVHRLDMQLSYDGLENGERYRLGPGEARYVVSSDVLEMAPPVLGLVDICAVYTGQMYIPDANGGEEITDDDQLSVILRYQVSSDADGVLTAEGRDNVELSEVGDTSLCDEYVE